MVVAAVELAVISPEVCRVLEAVNTPITLRVDATVEEAEEIKPAFKEAKPLASKVLEKVEEAVVMNPALVVRRPLTPKVETAVEEATEIKPLSKVPKPLSFRVPDTVVEAPFKTASPATVKEEEAFNGPPRLRTPETVEEAEEINPPDKVARLVAEKLPEVVRLLEKVPKPAESPASVEVPEMFKLPKPIKLLEKVPNEAETPDKEEVPVMPKVPASAPPAKVEVPEPIWILAALTVEEAAKWPAT